MVPSSATGVALQSVQVEQPVPQLEQPVPQLEQPLSMPQVLQELQAARRQRSLVSKPVRQQVDGQQSVAQQSVETVSQAEQVATGVGVVQQGVATWVVQQEEVVTGVVQHEVRERNSRGPQEDLATGWQQRVFMRQNNWASALLAPNERAIASMIANAAPPTAKDRFIEISKGNEF